MDSISSDNDQRGNSSKLSTSSAYSTSSPSVRAAAHASSSSHSTPHSHSASEQLASSSSPIMNQQQQQQSQHPSSTSTGLSPTIINSSSVEFTSNVHTATNHDGTTLLAGPEELLHPDISTAEAIIRRRSRRQSVSLLRKLSQRIGLEKTGSTKSNDHPVDGNSPSKHLDTNMSARNDGDDNNNHSDSNNDGRDESGSQILLPHTATDPLPPSNSIRTSRYTMLNFLPRQLIAQFSKVANLYFVFISALQLVPDWSPTGRFTTLLPLAIFVTIAMAHEAYDDICRHRMDKVENERKCEVLRVYRTPATTNSTSTTSANHRSNELNQHNISIDMTGSEGSHSVACVWQEIRWRQLAVGDIVRIKQDDWIPADLLLLHSSLDDNICYVETAALDGETNLKEMRVPEALCDQTSTPEQIAELSGYVQAEDPNDDLYDFNGCIHFYSRKTSMENKQKEHTTSSRNDNNDNAIGNTPSRRQSFASSNDKLTSESKIHLSLLSRSSLDIRNLLLRGTILRNTTDVYGMVIYSGENTKIRQNALKNARTKAPMLQRHVNRAVISVFILLLVLASLMTAMQSTWLKKTRAAYLPHDNSASGASLLIGQDMEMYDPVSDTPAEARTSAINEDLGQFRACSVAGVAYRNTSTEEDGSCPLPMSTAVSSILTSRAITHIESDEWWFLRALSLCHSVVPSIQSDPTTGAEMAINYQSPSPDEHALVSGARDFGFELRERQGQHIRIHIKADATMLASTSATHDTALATSAIGSPVLDVGTNALPSPAISLPPDMLSLQHNNDKDGRHIPEEYEVLDELAFSSRRKRMSVVVRLNDGRLVLLTKGADNVMLGLLSYPSIGLIRQSQSKSNVNANDKEEERDASHQDTAVAKQTLYHLDQFAQVGLRTLVYAYRFLDPDEYSAWHKQYVDAQSAITDRVQRMESVMSLIERPNPTTGEGLRMCGITAVEDRLQPGVPETIAALRRAGIGVFMLTGDKMETAINIGRSCSLISPLAQVITISGESDHHGSNGTSKPDEQSDAALAVREQLINARDSLPLVTRSTLLNHVGGSIGIGQLGSKHIVTRDGTGRVLVIDGAAIQLCRDDQQANAVIVELASVCDSVICCRVSPCQKASIVQLMRKQHPHAVTLAIGDGGNDIAMIQEAHVGIGITGREGLQAARASDYSIARFRFLQRLLLVHGRWSYVRVSKFTLGTFYKCIAFYLTQACFQAFTGFSGTSLYEQWTLSLYNTVFSALPVIILGITEQDLSASTLMRVPELYRMGHADTMFNLRRFWSAMLHGMLQSASLMLIPFAVYGGLPGGISRYSSPQLFQMGIVVYTSVVLAVNIKVAMLDANYWSWLTGVGVALETAAWFLFQMVYAIIYPSTKSTMGYDVHGQFIQAAAHYQFWALIIVNCTVVLLPEIIVRTLRTSWHPSDVTIFQQMEYEQRRQERQRKTTTAAASRCTTLEPIY
ncbi:hypothetical protein BDF22DRAFT_739545 [Syncephalis plumigaleata]|nr:hypothetical protein BDF22DRAFT_739545 [Syncephalis plumigaleata]